MYRINPVKRVQAMDVLSTVLGKKGFSTYQGIESRVMPILDSITTRLPYHGKHHPLDDVGPGVVILGHAAGIDRSQMRILAPSSLMHDIGMKTVYNGHEEAGTRIARRILKDYGFAPGELRAVDDIIMATKLMNDPVSHKLVQSPDSQNELQKLMCDGDLGNLAENYLNAGFALQRELVLQFGSTMGYMPPNTVLDWFKLQLAFIKNHGVWFTDAANKLYNGGQEKNIADLNARIDELEKDPSKNQEFGKFLVMPLEEAWKKLNI